jgi:hypothetical protein
MHLFTCGVSPTRKVISKFFRLAQWQKGSIAPENSSKEDKEAVFLPPPKTRAIRSWQDAHPEKLPNF